MTDLYEDPKAAADEAAKKLAQLTGVDQHDVAIVLGSGWGHAADLFGRTVAEFPATELPGFPPPPL